MSTQTDRRSFILEQSSLAIGLAAAATLAGASRVLGSPAQPPEPTPAAGSWPGFQQQDPALVREIVGASHANIKRVKELVGAHPELAKAAYDWGFGDWKTALGAASHTGNREIAAILLENGARLDVFAATMLGMTEVVKAVLAAQPALARTRGPHGISLVAHATAGQNDELAAFLRTVDGAGDDAVKPITPEEMKTYLGAYTRESGGAVIVSQTKFGMALKAEGGFDVRLTRTGEHTFHPAGAPRVRIAFTVKDGAASRVEIVEDAWMVSATRKS